ncbi:hypothetical protein ALQ44_00733 [Pseudomonas syringae pv. pisi]|uniref:Uncharacterized protein n=1 Tax=Pseudomonas syringae pv. pisi TaxID=59510 RepID=A0A3M3U6E6_PSESJ|nr:hypothetical protein ALQ44_00733 [Pseudomonas syringae pv. pisi]
MGQRNFGSWVNSASAATGWELLAITASDIGPMYTVGRREVKKAPLDGFALGDHVTKG